MLEEDQARAYAEADFAEPHDHFVELFGENFPQIEIEGLVLDLGCGPADVTLRFARSFPGCVVHGVDGSEAMLRFGNLAVQRENLVDRVQLFHFYLPCARLTGEKYDCVISNSLLHHLKDPQALWRTVKEVAKPGAPVFVMDLVRPSSEAEAEELVQIHAEGEPDVLRSDFYNSLLAAYQPHEVAWQLQEARLVTFETRIVSDRHLIVYGLR